MLQHRFLLACLLILSSNTGFAWWAWTPGDHVDNSIQSQFVNGYHPDQPIPFSHKLHAGDRGIECQYCHNAARRSQSAGIPPMNTCMGCHKIVKADAEPIKMMAKMYKENEPVVWTKVHDLPDYVRFTHQPHVLAKDSNGNQLLSCESCHGEVKEMTTVAQWAPLQMGWCIECHNKQREPVSPGGPVLTYAPTSCNTCHH